MLAPWKRCCDQPRQHIKKQRHYFADKSPSSQSYGFSSSHVWIWELGHKEGWVLKNWCFWTVILEKTLESPSDCTEIKPVNPKGSQSWIFTGSIDAEPEAPILLSPDVKSRLIGKDPDAGKDWRQEEKGMTEDQMVGWHHWLDGHEFEQALGDGEGQGSLLYAVHEVSKSWHNWGTEQQQQINCIYSHARAYIQCIKADLIFPCQMKKLRPWEGPLSCFFSEWDQLWVNHKTIESECWKENYRPFSLLLLL